MMIQNRYALKKQCGIPSLFVETRETGRKVSFSFGLQEERECREILFLMISTMCLIFSLSEHVVVPVPFLITCRLHSVLTTLFRFPFRNICQVGIRLANLFIIRAQQLLEPD